MFAAQIFGQVEQKGADRSEGLVAVGDENFITCIGSDGEERG